MKNLRLFSMAILVAFAFAACNQQPAKKETSDTDTTNKQGAMVNEQKKEEKQVDNQSARGEGKSDENVQTPKAKNDPQASNQAPENRGDVYGSDYCDVKLRNYTGYYIDIYVDGSFRGTLGPWEDRVSWAIPGKTKLYGRADFDDGSWLYWGPIEAECSYEYTWNLRP